MRPRGDLAGRLAATLNKSLKGRARRVAPIPVFRRQPKTGFFCGPLRRQSKGVTPMGATKDQKSGGIPWHPATKLVHEGTLRSQFGETSEAIFLNSGYVYQSAEQAEARFKGEEEGYVYSRYANPTV